MNIIFNNSSITKKELIKKIKSDWIEVEYPIINYTCKDYEFTSSKCLTIENIDFYIVYIHNERTDKKRLYKNIISRQDNIQTEI